MVSVAERIRRVFHSLVCDLGYNLQVQPRGTECAVHKRLTRLDGKCYSFVGVSMSIFSRIIWNYSYYMLMPWTSLCMAIFLVKTMKRVLFAGARSYDRDSSKHHYMLLFMGVAQFPLSFWLGYLRST
ncbi:hypothetical protein GOP47_0019457 [Adiantum capillus-veneris]|uniref:Uncharacterized protein n=1 Tax=Adiantum capillus-veneris TaxID=13818 RepID=A0A9D4Z8M7_ADICA|nr:hypothetical protein GOP47_0019457 [Adiantum capillus-veneris]